MSDFNAYDLVRLVSNWANSFEYDNASSLVHARQKELDRKKAFCDRLALRVTEDFAKHGRWTQFAIETDAYVTRRMYELYDEQHDINTSMLRYVAAGRA
jgi:hypothetical protein